MTIIIKFVYIMILLFSPFLVVAQIYRKPFITLLTLCYLIDNLSFSFINFVFLFFFSIWFCITARWCLYDKDCPQNMCRPGRIPKCIFGHCNCVKERSWKI